MFHIEFYETEDGKQPVSDFLDSLDSKMAAKMISLEDDIFELRCKVGSNISRALYFFYVGKTIVVTNGFVKKTQKTPSGEIKLAKARRQDWLSRNQEKERHMKGRG